MNRSNAFRPPEWARTTDPRNHNPMLWPTELQGELRMMIRNNHNCCLKRCKGKNSSFLFQNVGEGENDFY